MTVVAATPPATAPSNAASTMTRIAALTYPSAWILGLVVSTTGPALDAPAVEIAQHYAEHGGSAALQSILVHGVAGVALAAVAVGVGRLGGGAATAVRRAGLAAAALSLVQAVLGIVAATTTGAGDTARADQLFDALGRVDGLKMVLLGVMAVAGAVLSRQGVLPRWLGWVGAVLAVAMVPAAAAYLTLSAALSPAAAPALALLLVWVTGAGVAAARR